MDCRKDQRRTTSIHLSSVNWRTEQNAKNIEKSASLLALGKNVMNYLSLPKGTLWFNINPNKHTGVIMKKPDEDAQVLVKGILGKH